ncbi:MAG TPA: MBL fold metallo-hydrolase [Candidatus Babeliales bacterium]|nr:MBL fold metallo-hydrolase [Candidatus Babeliales bacterium]
MKLTFLGTRGNIKIKSKRHLRHSSLLVESGTSKIMIDAGLDWKTKLKTINPDAIFITHAHPDHAGGLSPKTPCPVFTTPESWQEVKKYEIEECRLIMPGDPVLAGDLTIEAFEVMHSLKAPAVGFRISDDEHTIFYVPDVVKIKKEKKALEGVDLYIGDGAIIKRSLLVRKKNNTEVGHAPIIMQLQWCKKNKISRMIVTHCGTEITAMDPHEADEIIHELGDRVRVITMIAYDGLKIPL